MKEKYTGKKEKWTNKGTDKCIKESATYCLSVSNDADQRFLCCLLYLLKALFENMNHYLKFSESVKSNGIDLFVLKRENGHKNVPMIK